MKILFLFLNLLFVIILLTQISSGEGKDRDKHKSCRGGSRSGSSDDACNPESRDRGNRIKKYEKEHQGRYHDDDDDDEDDDDDDDDYDDSAEDLIWTSDDEGNSVDSKRTGEGGDKSKGKKIKVKDDEKSKKTRQVPGEGKGKSEFKKNKDKGDKEGQATINENRGDKGKYRREKGDGIRKKELRPTESKERKSGKEPNKEKPGMNKADESGDKPLSQDSTTEGEGETTSDDEASRTLEETVENTDGLNEDSEPKDIISEAGASVHDTSKGELEKEEMGDGSTHGNSDAAKESAEEMSHNKITGDHETERDVETLHGGIAENIADKEELKEASLDNKDASVMENGTPDAHADAHVTVEKADGKVDNPATEGEMTDVDGGGFGDSSDRASTPESVTIRELPPVTLEFDSSTMLPEHLRVGQSDEPEEESNEETLVADVSGGRRVVYEDYIKESEEEEEVITDSNNNKIHADSVNEDNSQNEGVDEVSTLESEHDIDSDGELENLETESRPEEVKYIELETEDQGIENPGINSKGEKDVEDIDATN